MAGDVQVGGGYVTLSAKADQLVSMLSASEKLTRDTLSRMGDAATGFARSFTNALGGSLPTLALSAAGVGTGVGLMVKEFFDSQDAMKNLAIIAAESGHSFDEVLNRTDRLYESFRQIVPMTKETALQMAQLGMWADTAGLKLEDFFKVATGLTGGTNKSPLDAAKALADVVAGRGNLEAFGVFAGEGAIPAQILQQGIEAGMKRFPAVKKAANLPSSTWDRLKANAADWMSAAGEALIEGTQNLITSESTKGSQVERARKKAWADWKRKAINSEQLHEKLSALAAPGVGDSLVSLAGDVFDQYYSGQKPNYRRHAVDLFNASKNIYDSIPSASELRGYSNTSESQASDVASERKMAGIGGETDPVLANQLKELTQAVRANTAALEGGRVEY